MEQTKGTKVLYTIFLLAVTIRTVVAIYDRFKPHNNAAN